MRWSKIKNIIIVLLAMVNVCLLFIVGARLWRTEHSDRELRERMLVILERNGIELLSGEVPGEMPLAGRQLTLNPFGEEQAAALVGQGKAGASPDGAAAFEGELGTAAFFPDGMIDVRFAPGAYPLNGAELSETCSALLKALGVEAEETRREDGGVTFTQLWAGAPVPQAVVTLTERDGALFRLSGRILRGNDATVEGEYLSAPTALIRFLEELQKQVYVCSQITGIYPGYAISGTGTVSLTPTWYLETDAAWRCAVNGVTGEVTVEEPSSFTPSA